ncbi:hypothetical protein BV22DRAFT_1127548 [Leucogyrophana mollusca]|uniref:Uncharacterized protein n=1 Tax=Leucogyrophana mollusca TaxID=85980 RepID=A0ACB8BPA5_9AGAM|nr:hypothetical protein BV22DRAFT_1127548 [Leucogyrophana mollusca]
MLVPMRPLYSCAPALVPMRPGLILMHPGLAIITPPRSRNSQVIEPDNAMDSGKGPQEYKYTTARPTACYVSARPGLGDAKGAPASPAPHASFPSLPFLCFTLARGNSTGVLNRTPHPSTPPSPHPSQPPLPPPLHPRPRKLQRRP